MNGFSRRQQSQRMARLYAVMTCLLIVVVGQFVLLLVGVESFWRGQTQILLASTLASAVGLAGATWLVRYIIPGGTHEN